MISRRNMMTAACGGFAAYASRQGTARAFEAALRNGARRVVILWMEGGPSQLETFDPKPGTVTGGPTGAIATNVPGVHFADHLPLLTGHASNLCVIRTLTSTEGQHDRARYLNHTGFKPIAAFPRPELGSLVAHAKHDGSLPGFITLGGAGYGPAYLGDEFAPFSIANPEETVRLLAQLRRGRNRFELLGQLTADFDGRFLAGPVHDRRVTLARIEGLLDSRLPELLDSQREPVNALKRYGGGEFGNRLLTARRLLDGGVTCVEVQLGGWDTHQNNFATVPRLCQQLDRPFAALIEDLKASGLWDETLVIWMGDFGRTPTINGQSGRDHFPRISNAVLAGGGVPGGSVVGETNRGGTEIVADPVPTADLFATVLHRIGVEPDAQYQTTFGSPTEATDGGNVIAALA